MESAGTGSTFTLSIPAYLRDGDSKTPMSDDDERTRTAMTSVLIVEDEESLADPLAFLLRKEGFEATVVADGPSALANSSGPVPTSCCWDLIAAGMSGTDVCKQLRSRSSVR